MALQVWMPLNNNLNNQGVNGLSATQTTAPTYVNGKIGKAMSTGGFTLPAAEVAKFYNNEEMSFCFWLYPVGTSGGSHIIGQSAMAAGDNRMFTIFQYPTPNDLHLSWQSNEANNSTFFSSSDTGFFTADNWTHCTIVYNGNAGNVKIYKNGSLYKTYTCTKSPRTNFSYNVPVPSVSIRYLNDLRIYNHALSEKEVKEISKGLVAHYRLDDYGPNPNMINNSMPYTSNSGWSAAGTGWGAPTLTANSTSPSGYVIRSTYTGTGNQSGGPHKQPYSYSSLENGATYNLSGWVRGSSSFPATFKNEMMTSVTPSQTINITTEWQFFSVYGPINTAATYHSDIIYATGSNVPTNSWIEVYGLKLEKGNVATAWIPHTSDSQYSLYSSATPKDSSGYGNHGTFSDSKAAVSNESSKYNSCMLFNGTNNYIKCGRGAMVTDAITVTAWAYMDDWSTYSARIISCTESGGWNFEPAGSSKINFAMGTGTSGNTYKSVSSATAVTGSGWHMFTGTYDGFSTKIYLDGVLSNTNNAYSTKTPIYYNTTNGIFIGAEAGGDTTTPSGSYFNGKISDIRIYATALSADDIKELYQSSASLCNNGVLMCSEFVEQ